MNPTLDLFSPLTLGSLSLANRIVMAPMTRLRADGTVPTETMATYYAQRASAGLIVTECTMVSPLSRGYLNCPGIYNSEQIAGWRKVTNAVHERGGKCFLQLWHCGRVSHPALLDGQTPIAPSAIAGEGQLHTPIGKVSLETPRALETEEILGVVEEFRQGAKNALDAGFDGVELHGAFGYLIDQFLQDGSNQRTDKYGGSIAGRARFALEVVSAVTEVWGTGRVGIKLSPSNTYYGMRDSDPKAAFGYLIQALNSFPVAYIHLMEPNESDLSTGRVLHPVAPLFRPLYKGTLMTNGGYNKASGNSALINGHADLVSFGRPFIANPDLPERFARDAAIAEATPETYYGQGAEGSEAGYIDYPFLET